jgi:hypothetical protein
MRQKPWDLHRAPWQTTADRGATRNLSATRPEGAAPSPSRACCVALSVSAKWPQSANDPAPRVDRARGAASLPGEARRRGLADHPGAVRSARVARRQRACRLHRPAPGVRPPLGCPWHPPLAGRRPGSPCPRAGPAPVRSGNPHPGTATPAAVVRYPPSRGVQTARTEGLQRARNASSAQVHRPARVRNGRS